MNLYTKKQQVEVLDGKRWLKAKTIWVIREAFDPERHPANLDDGLPEAWMVELRNGNRGGYDVNHMRAAAPKPSLDTCHH